MKMYNETKIGGVLYYAKKFFDDVADTQWARIFKVFVVVLLLMILSGIGFFGYTVIKNQYTIDKFITGMVDKKKEDIENMKIRDAVSPEISRELRKAVYAYGADRAVVFELHNGKENATHLPFKYADMSYEEVNDNNKEIQYVSDNFQNLSLTHYAMPHYIAEHTYFIGNTDEARLIDPRYTQLMEHIGGQYMWGMILRSDGVSIGFVILYFDKSYKSKRSVAEIQGILNDLSSKLTPLLDLSIQKNKMKKQ